MLELSRFDAVTCGSKLLVDVLNLEEIACREYYITLAIIEKGSTFFDKRPFEMRSSLMCNSSRMVRISYLNFF